MKPNRGRLDRRIAPSVLVYATARFHPLQKAADLGCGPPISPRHKEIGKIDIFCGQWWKCWLRPGTVQVVLHPRIKSFDGLVVRFDRLKTKRIVCRERSEQHSAWKTRDTDVLIYTHGVL
eukprot:7389599-Prymnesium_polylepis.1